jgi:hypothetical protein
MKIERIWGNYMWAYWSGGVGDLIYDYSVSTLKKGKGRDVFAQIAIAMFNFWTNYSYLISIPEGGGAGSVDVDVNFFFNSYIKSYKSDDHPSGVDMEPDHPTVMMISKCREITFRVHVKIPFGGKASLLIGYAE